MSSGITNVASADQVYVDPSALSCLYVHHAERSGRVAKWRMRIKGALAVTHHGRVEIVNAICRARFTGDLDRLACDEALADLDSDFADGRLRQADLLWRAALNRATALSCEFTPQFGTRGADVLHVACALEMKCTHFLTFDERQETLARAVGMKIVST